jgi:hypothetical protein
MEIAPSGVTVRGPFTGPRHFPMKAIACVRRLGSRVVKLEHHDPSGRCLSLVNTIFESRKAPQVYAALRAATTVVTDL